MAFYKTCPFCGANLDPGETCDCQTEKKHKEEEIEKIVSRLKTEKGGQLTWESLAS
ncbi:MAG: hypothetical protein J5943_03265 [Oribacterium sp.]|nr:hypothetical protein [Oribacterium sp.]